MTRQTKEITWILVGSALLGIAVDFIFNGVAVRLLFHGIFDEKWMYIYLPTDFAVAMMISGYLSYSKWASIAWFSVLAFVVGVLIGHLRFAGHQSTIVYPMKLVGASPVILKSNEWPQILFVTADQVQQKLIGRMMNDRVDVKISTITDYGCVRSAVVSTIDDVDVNDDRGATWTWRLNEFVATSEAKGPGMEDLRFPWCPHFKALREIEDGSSRAPRPWDDVLKETKHQ